MGLGQVPKSNGTRILVPTAGPGTNFPWIPRDDCSLQLLKDPDALDVYARL